jgi:hypothetical protein
MKIRSGLYRAGSALGNVKAVTTGRVPQRVARVAAYRQTGRALRASGCLVPCVAVVVAVAMARWQCWPTRSCVTFWPGCGHYCRRVEMSDSYPPNWTPTPQRSPESITRRRPRSWLALAWWRLLPAVGAPGAAAWPLR